MSQASEPIYHCLGLVMSPSRLAENLIQTAGISSRHDHIRQWEVTLVDLCVIQAPVWGQIAIYSSLLIWSCSWKRSCFGGSLRFWWIQQVSENHLLDKYLSRRCCHFTMITLLPSSISGKKSLNGNIFDLERKITFPMYVLTQIQCETQFIF